MFQPNKKKCSSWSSHLLQCESQSLHDIKAGENQASLVPLLAKLVVRIPLSPLELLIISFQFQYFFFETYALNDFHFVPSYPLLLFSWWFHRGYTFTSVLIAKITPPHSLHGVNEWY